MKRLIAKGLMFGNLVEVSSPQLVDRYNRALKHLTGQETTLTDFHITPCPQRATSWRNGAECLA